MFWENGDLRYVALEGRELLRRIYVATRDRNWGTAPNIITDVAMEVEADAFRIRFQVENRQDDIWFTWRGEITGSPEGQIRFSMDGAARTTFLKNRVGFCILHPASLAGARCRVDHVDGTSQEATLPTLLDPRQPLQPFAEMAGMAHEAMPGVWVELKYGGDIFEMEDQRNWTDASYKTFSTPLRLPHPVEVLAGSRIFQTVTLLLRVEREGAELQVADTPAPLTFDVDAASSPCPLPPIGLGMASHGATLTATQIARLEALSLAHLRVDLRLSDPGHRPRLAQACAEARALGAPLEIGLFVSPDRAEVELNALRDQLDALRPDVCRWLVFPVEERFGGGSPLREVLAPARVALKGYGHAPLVSGTNNDYIFLARSVPSLELVDALTFAMNPQVHACDNSSLVETLACQDAVVRNARALAADRPVYVSPVTLKMRHNPYATATTALASPHELPPQVDPRQMSLFAACWTAASVRSLAHGGAAGVTYYETTGWRGVMEVDQGPPAPDRFRSIPGGVFPVYHILASIGEFAGGEVLASGSSDPLEVDGIVLRHSGRLRWLIANMTDAPHTVMVRGLSRAHLHRLDASNAEEAMRAPEVWRTRPGVRLEASSTGELSVDLPPFAIAQLDCPGIWSAAHRLEAQ
jgi:hypothetical protein